MNRLLVTASKSVGSRCNSFGNNIMSTNLSHPPVALRSHTVRKFADVSYDGITNDVNEIKRGTVKNFHMKNGWGFIVPDGVDVRNHKDEELLFIHRVDIKTRDLGSGEERYFPSLKPGQRVQFKVGPPANSKAPAGKAYDLTYEGGGLVAPFQPGYLESYISKQKAMFGDEVYDIFSTSRDQKELEMKIVAAFDRVKGNIERQRAKVERFHDLEG